MYYINLMLQKAKEKEKEARAINLADITKQCHTGILYSRLFQEKKKKKKKNDGLKSGVTKAEKKERWKKRREQDRGCEVPKTKLERYFKQLLKKMLPRKRVLFHVSSS